MPNDNLSMFTSEGRTDIPNPGRDVGVWTQSGRRPGTCESLEAKNNLRSYGSLNTPVVSQDTPGRTKTPTGVYSSGRGSQSSITISSSFAILSLVRSPEFEM